MLTLLESINLQTVWDKIFPPTWEIKLLDWVGQNLLTQLKILHYQTKQLFVVKDNCLLLKTLGLFEIQEMFNARKKNYATQR